MADNIGNKAAHDYHLDVPVAQEGFYVKGAAHCDFGMKSRLARMFDPKSGNTVMLALTTATSWVLLPGWSASIW